MRNKPSLPHRGPVHCCVKSQRLSAHVLLRTPTELQAASQTPHPVQLSSLQPKLMFSYKSDVILVGYNVYF